MTISVGDYPSSAFRYALLDIKPVRYEEMFKVGSLRFRRTRIAYEHKDQIQSFEDYSNLRYSYIFTDMPIPPNFSEEKVFDHFLNTSIKNFHEDKEFQNMLAEKNRTLLGLVSFIQKRFEDDLDSYYLSEAFRFYHSNFPLSFFTKTSINIDTTQKFLYLIQRIVRRFELNSSRPGVRFPFEQREYEMRIMQETLSPLIDRMDLLCRASSQLKIYSSIWSATDFKEIDRPRFLDIKKLDIKQFEEFNKNFESELECMRRMIYEASIEYDKEIFNEAKSSDEPTFLMLSNLLLSH